MGENKLQSSLPVHVGIIMDGNGRWAKKRGVPRTAGHKYGADAFGKIALHAAKIGIKHLTVYAFSTENWRRPQEEVDSIMNLLRSYLKNVEKYTKDNMKLCVLGNMSQLDEDLQQQIIDIQRRSKDNTGMVLNIALNYGSRDEILHSAKALAQQYKDGAISDLDSVGEDYFSGLLYTQDQPDVDLVIRTSGELRISNFLLWQSAYAEYVFCDEFWPDFTPQHFDKAIEQYTGRSRRRGGV